MNLVFESCGRFLSDSRGFEPLLPLSKSVFMNLFTLLKRSKVVGIIDRNGVQGIYGSVLVGISRANREMAGLFEWGPSIPEGYKI